MLMGERRGCKDEVDRGEPALPRANQFDCD